MSKGYSTMVSREDKLRLSLETGFSLRTIDKWASGGRVAIPTAIALGKAATEMGRAEEILSQIGEKSPDTTTCCHVE